MAESHRLYDAWRRAERVASELERELAEANLAYARGAGPLPSRWLMEEVRVRRAHAHQLLCNYLEQIRRDSESIRNEVHRIHTERRLRPEPAKRFSANDADSGAGDRHVP